MVEGAISVVSFRLHSTFNVHCLLERRAVEERDELERCAYRGGIAEFTLLLLIFLL